MLRVRRATLLMACRRPDGSPWTTMAPSSRKCLVRVVIPFWSYQRLDFVIFVVMSLLDEDRRYSSLTVSLITNVVIFLFFCISSSVMCLQRVILSIQLACTLLEYTNEIGLLPNEKAREKDQLLREWSDFLSLVFIWSVIVFLTHHLVSFFSLT